LFFPRCSLHTQLFSCRCSLFAALFARRSPDAPLLNAALFASRSLCTLSRRRFLLDAALFYTALLRRSLNASFFERPSCARHSLARRSAAWFNKVIMYHKQLISPRSAVIAKRIASRFGLGLAPPSGKMGHAPLHDRVGHFERWGQSCGARTFGHAALLTWGSASGDAWACVATLGHAERAFSARAGERAGTGLMRARTSPF
jgi:hypothetical protein